MWSLARRSELWVERWIFVVEEGWWEVEKVRRCVEVEGSCVASFPKEGNNVLDEYLSILTLFKSTFLI
jgi:hypothetical protein